MFRLLPSKWLTTAIFTFYSLCGFYFIVVQMQLSHAPDRFLEVHRASKVPLSLTNHTLPLLDKFLTPLISFFVAAFGDTSSTAYPTVTHFVWSFGCAIQVPFLEAQRIGVDGSHHKRSRAVALLAHPMIWGILYQRLSGGWIIPLWIALFMQSEVRAVGNGIERFKAESVLAGWWIGHTIPALVMLIPGLPALHKAPLWVGFPILMSVAQQSYLHIRKRFSRARITSGSHSGSIPVQLLYISGFIGAFIAHVHLVLIPGLSAASYAAPTNVVFIDKQFGLGQFLYKFFVPATGLRIPSPAETTAESGVVHFVQFDVIVVFSALWTALIWDLAMRRDPLHTPFDTCRWVIRMAAGLFAGSLLLSPGAVTSLLLLYREAKLENSRRDASCVGKSANERCPLLHHYHCPKRTNTY
ncbi:hypothetical protein ACEPAI_7418 [Sanghuangporus weigelae]